jgi:predicted metal-binding membrane protein
VSSAQPPDLTSRVIRHERALIAVSLAGLTALGWWYLLSRAETGMGTMGPPPLAALVLMWWLMMAAMMRR